LRRIPVVRELGIGFVSYYALGRGFFAGAVKNLSDLSPNDSRRKVPRFYQENFDHNAHLLKELQKVADAKQCTVAQLSLAWILHQGDFFVPIPGTLQISHLEENVCAADFVLSLISARWAISTKRRGRRRASQQRPLQGIEYLMRI
jgi:aryl-alcohol dehydrogenase-like predicted oxidoreductase